MWPPSFLRLLSSHSLLRLPFSYITRPHERAVPEDGDGAREKRTPFSWRIVMYAFRSLSPSLSQSPHEASGRVFLESSEKRRAKKPPGRENTGPCLAVVPHELSAGAVQRTSLSLCLRSGAFFEFGSPLKQ